MNLPPIFERCQESCQRFLAYSHSPEGRKTRKRYRVENFAHLVKSTDDRLRIREQAEQRERFHAYRAAHPPRHTNQ